MTNRVLCKGHHHPYVKRCSIHFSSLSSYECTFLLQPTVVQFSPAPCRWTELKYVVVDPGPRPIRYWYHRSDSHNWFWKDFTSNALSDTTLCIHPGLGLVQKATPCGHKCMHLTCTCTWCDQTSLKGATRHTCTPFRMQQHFSMTLYGPGKNKKKSAVPVWVHATTVLIAQY